MAVRESDWECISVCLSVKERLFRNAQLCQIQCFGLQLIYFTRPHFTITFLNYFNSFYYFCEFWNWDAILASACFVKENMLYLQPWGNVIVPYNPSFFLRTESLVYFGGWTAFCPASVAQTVREEIVIFLASAHRFSSSVEEEVAASRAWELSLAHGPWAERSCFLLSPFLPTFIISRCCPVEG